MIARKAKAQIRRRTPDAAEVREAIAAKTELSARHFGQGSQPVPRVWGPARRVGDAIHRIPGHIHAIGVGRKIVNGKHTSTVSVRVYVMRKLPNVLIPPDARIPKEIDGIPTDVVETLPAFLAWPPVPPACSRRRLELQRPVRGGISGANEAVNAGTLAAVCRSTLLNEAQMRFVLGNNHTLADLGAALIGSAVLQPSAQDRGTSANRIARLARFIPIDEREDAANRVDAAIAELESTVAMQTDICGVGSPTGAADPIVDAPVQKHGRTTGLTSGVIDDPSVDVIVPLSRAHPERVARFVEQIRIRPAAGSILFAQGGDSGALVTTRTNRAVGLLFACPDNGSFAYANPIQAVLNALQIALV